MKQTRYVTINVMILHSPLNSLHINIEVYKIMIMII